ncbi:MAG: hypothetical protein M1338_00565 [Patescibacteria group bacterium]|nr:hypothetical protein [Patescibacteria group bacterium]
MLPNEAPVDPADGGEIGWLGLPAICKALQAEWSRMRQYPSETKIDSPGQSTASF